MCTILMLSFISYVIVSVVIYRKMKTTEEDMITTMERDHKSKHDLSNNMSIIVAIYESTWGEMSDYEPEDDKRKDGIKKIRTALNNLHQN